MNICILSLLTFLLTYFLPVEIVFGISIFVILVAFGILDIDQHYNLIAFIIV